MDKSDKLFYTVMIGMVVVLVLITIFAMVTIIANDNKCEELGGIQYRSLCLKPDSVLR